MPLRILPPRKIKEPRLYQVRNVVTPILLRRLSQQAPTYTMSRESGVPGATCLLEWTALDFLQTFYSSSSLRYTADVIASSCLFGGSYFLRSLTIYIPKSGMLRHRGGLYAGCDISPPPRVSFVIALPQNPSNIIRCAPIAIKE